MTTDVYRLHELIDDLEERQERIFHRGIGKTTLHIHQLAGQIQVGDDRRIIVQIKFLRDMSWLCPMITEIFAEQGIEIIHRRWTTFPEWIQVRYEGRDVTLYFFPIGEGALGLYQYVRQTRGYDCLEFNLVDY